MKIALFDSGIGGLTVLKDVLESLPNEDFIYFSDGDNAPYGNKSKEQIREYVFNAVDFLADKNIKALLVACNTATSVAIDDLRDTHNFPIIGMEPAVKPAVQNESEKRVLVFATELTLKEERFQNLVSKIDTNNIVDYLPLQQLVMFAENFQFDDETIIPYLQKQLSGLNLDEYGTIVLGCTHFPYFINHFKQVIPSEIQIIDGNEGTINNLKRKLEGHLNNGSGKIEYYLSSRPGDPEYFEKYLSYYKSLES